MAGKTKKRSIKREEYTITYRKGAYYKLKEIARDLDLPEDELGKVLEKGIRLLDFAKDGKVTIEKYGVKLEVDLKKL